MRYVIVAILFLAGCGPARVGLPGTLTVSRDFTAEQTETVLRSAEAWEAATSGVAHLQIGIGDEGAVNIRPAPIDGWSIGDTHIRSNDTVDMRIDLSQVEFGSKQNHVTSELELQDTVMHELGHAFGLEHVPGTLMRASGFGGAAVDPDTLHRFCENYQCR